MRLIEISRGPARVIPYWWVVVGEGGGGRLLYVGVGDGGGGC
jgi:hypothetical protein